MKHNPTLQTELTAAADLLRYFRSIKNDLPSTNDPHEFVEECRIAHGYNYRFTLLWAQETFTPIHVVIKEFYFNKRHYRVVLDHSFHISKS